MISVQSGRMRRMMAELVISSRRVMSSRIFGTNQVALRSQQATRISLLVEQVTVAGLTTSGKLAHQIFWSIFLIDEKNDAVASII